MGARLQSQPWTQAPRDLDSFARTRHPRATAMERTLFGVMPGFDGVSRPSAGIAISSITTGAYLGLRIFGTVQAGGSAQLNLVDPSVSDRPGPHFRFIP